MLFYLCAAAAISVVWKEGELFLGLIPFVFWDVRVIDHADTR